MQNIEQDKTSKKKGLFSSLTPSRKRRLTEATLAAAGLGMAGLATFNFLNQDRSASQIPPSPPLPQIEPQVRNPNIIATEHRGNVDTSVFPDKVRIPIDMPDGRKMMLEVSKEALVQELTKPRSHDYQSESLIHWPTVEGISEYLWKSCGDDRVKYVGLVMDFISLNTTYQTDVPTEYPKSPLETLFEKGGDCEDLAILAASLFAAKNIKTGIAYSPAHASVAVSFDSMEGQKSYPEIQAFAKLFNHSKFRDPRSTFDPESIQPFGYLVIPNSMKYTDAIKAIKEKEKRNKYYESAAKHHLFLESSGEIVTVHRGSDYLTSKERASLSTEDALRLTRERRAKAKSPEEINIDTSPFLIRTRIKYFYLEATAGARWRMHEGCPIDLDFFPAKESQYPQVE